MKSTHIETTMHTQNVTKRKKGERRETPQNMDEILHIWKDCSIKQYCTGRVVELGVGRRDTDEGGVR